MDIVYNNIDDCYSKIRRERRGEVQPKYWFCNNFDGRRVLVKRQHRERVNGQKAKSRTYNHFGELFAYILADKVGMKACPVQLVSLHDFRNDYGKNKYFFTACMSECMRQPDESITPGESVINNYRYHNSKNFDEIVRERNYSYKPEDVNMVLSPDDNVDVAIEAIKYETRRYEEKMGVFSDEDIEMHVDNNVQDMIDMIVFDNIFGNSDRHNENWSVIYSNIGTMYVYPMYDNEAILGFRRPEAMIKALANRGLSHDLNARVNFSRMGFSPIHSGVTYKSMLEHLMLMYPEQTVNSMNKIINNVSISDLEQLYDSAKGITYRSQDHNELTENDELPNEYKTYGLTLYKDRYKYAKHLIKQHELKLAHEDNIHDIS